MNIEKPNKKHRICILQNVVSLSGSATGVCALSNPKFAMVKTIVLIGQMNLTAFQMVSYYFIYA